MATQDLSINNLSRGLLSDLKAGKIYAFDKMLSIFEKPIFNYVYRLVGHKQDAEDLTQDVFIKVFKNRETINLDKNFKSWVFKIATNTVFDWFRSKQRKLEILFEEKALTELPETIIDTPAYYLTEREVERALETIKPEYKTVLMLFYYQGFSYDEIGSILGIPLNTVKTYIYRAKKELKKQILR